MKIEYRVVWKREGARQRSRKYTRLSAARRFVALFGPEPWKGYEPDRSGDDFLCCSGRECGCGGQTVREWHDEKRRDLPPLEYIRIESREVGDYSELPNEQGALQCQTKKT